MTPCFITKNSRIWKSQIHKCYRMTTDTNNYIKTKDTNSYEKKKKKRQTIMKYQETHFGLPLPTLPF